jgi:hypothetical protein
VQSNPKSWQISIESICSEGIETTNYEAAVPILCQDISLMVECFVPCIIDKDPRLDPIWTIVHAKLVRHALVIKKLAYL